MAAKSKTSEAIPTSSAASPPPQPVRVKNPVLGSLFRKKSHEKQGSSGKSKAVTTIVDEDGNLPEPPSDYSDSEEEESESEVDTPPPKKKREVEPNWVQTPELNRLLSMHERTDPDSVFGGCGVAPNLEDVFREGMNKKHFRARRSSAWTGKDRLTQAEILAYKKEMGYIVD
ncbi:hypothetical protein DFS34DRAFT_620662 [Phlyctochytrium arcticum]|nr:hypothetical protein DFS34DRAFT_620662 [Phlyctochytrium arcticum]